MEIRDGKKFTGYMKGVRKRTLDVLAQIPADKEQWRLGEDMSPIDTHSTDGDYWSELGEVELSAEIVGPTGDRIMLSRWLMLAPEHEIHHRSFLHAYRKIRGMAPHPIYGLTLEGLKEMLKQ